MDQQKMDNQGEEKSLPQKSSRGLLAEFFIDVLTNPLAWFAVVFHSYFTIIFEFSLLAYLLVWPFILFIIFLYANEISKKYEKKDTIFALVFVLNILLIFAIWGLNHFVFSIFSMFAAVMMVATAISNIRVHNKLSDKEKSQQKLPVMCGIVLSIGITFTLFSVIVGYAFMAALGGSEFYPVYGYYISFGINIIVSYFIAKSYPRKWLSFFYFFISPIVMYIVFNFFMSTLPRLIYR